MTYQQLAMSRVRAVEHDRAGDHRDHERGQRDDRPGRHGHREHDRQFTPDVLVDRTRAAGHHYAGRSRLRRGARMGAGRGRALVAVAGGSPWADAGGRRRRGRKDEDG